MKSKLKKTTAHKVTEKSRSNLKYGRLLNKLAMEIMKAEGKKKVTKETYKITLTEAMKRAKAKLSRYKKTEIDRMVSDIKVK